MNTIGYGAHIWRKTEFLLAALDCREFQASIDDGKNEYLKQFCHVEEKVLESSEVG